MLQENLCHAIALVAVEHARLFSARHGHGLSHYKSLGPTPDTKEGRAFIFTSETGEFVNISKRDRCGCDINQSHVR